MAILWSKEIVEPKDIGNGNGKISVMENMSLISLELFIVISTFLLS